MAFKFATGEKFDDASKLVSTAAQKLYDAEWHVALRRAIQSISNRVIAGDSQTSGTAAATKATQMASSCGTGGSGAAIGAPLCVLINGRAGTRSSCGTILLPAGTQTAATYVKYLLAGGWGSTGTCFAGNEAATSTAAYLPDCPDGLIALGYVEWLSPASATFNRNAQSVIAGSTAGTGTWVNLVHMPLYET